MNIRQFVCTAAVLVGVLGIAYAADENPLADAKVGEWTLAKNKISYPGGSMTNYTYSYVSKVAGKKITVVTQSLKEDGKTGMMAGQPAEIDLDKKAEGGEAKGPKPKISDDTVEVKGKKINCKKHESENETNGVKSSSITWISNDIPVYGLVKMVVKDKDGKETMVSEVVDYGMSGGADKPLK